MKKRYKKYLESFLQNHLLIVEDTCYFSREGKDCTGLICLDIDSRLYCIGRYSLYTSRSLHYYLLNKGNKFFRKLFKIFDFKLKEKYNTINTIFYL